MSELTLSPELVLKDYQRRTLEGMRGYLQALSAERRKEEKLRAVDPELAASFDFTVSAWLKAGGAGVYLPRHDGMKRPLPCVCVKVPTGGGKTFLAVKTIDLVNTHYRRSQNGLVLWIVPTSQIYRQTLLALKDRDHPYRQALETASGERVLVFERDTSFTPEDVAENLCILLLMLPAANRATKETLRMFRDSEGFQSFFPSEDARKEQAELVRRVTNLDVFEAANKFWGPLVKTSLGNVLRLLRPIVILDEGHKAYSAGARATLEGFNPSLIVEFSATPPAEGNILIEVSGRDLLQEGMIKLDLHLHNRRSMNWRDTLFAALECRAGLEEKALAYTGNMGGYIRPICLVQVERTGKEQRSSGRIHAEDVREYLINVQNIPPEQIAVKSSEKDELADLESAGGLLSESCPVRYIITKQALQEGWDCSFAYVLAILTNPSSETALTQLVGRILRQPYARKTGITELDESYVFCFQRRAESLLHDVRKGFAAEGLGDLHDRIRGDSESSSRTQNDTIVLPRPQFAAAIRKLVLPAFMVRSGDEWRPAHYDADILSRIPWDKVDVSPVKKLPLLDVNDKDVQLRANLDEAGFEDPGRYARAVPGVRRAEFDYAMAAAHLLDVMPNPWRGYELARGVFDALIETNPREQVLDNFVFVLDALHQRLEAERDRLAEEVFRSLLTKDVMRFLLIAEDLGVNSLPEKIIKKAGERRATRENGDPFSQSLFDYVGSDDLNSLEQKVATYLDEQDKLLFFWHRNRAKADFGVQGWKRGRIFADFIVAARDPSAKADFDRVFVVETKGLHLKRFADTDYKRSVFELCNDLAQRQNWSMLAPAMAASGMRFEVVDQEEWQKRLNEILKR